MSWLVLVEIILLAIVIAIGIQWFRVRNKLSRCDKTPVKAVLIFVCVILIFISLIMPFAIYNDAVSLPYKYQCACETVEEIKEMLMRYENLTDSFGSIGQGLESMELKQAISEAIEEKNDLKAEILAWLNNPLFPYRDVLRANLPSDFLEELNG